MFAVNGGRYLTGRVTLLITLRHCMLLVMAGIDEGDRVVSAEK
jgi:hypothetical protein